jgi:hypothetical protein
MEAMSNSGDSDTWATQEAVMPFTLSPNRVVIT